MECRYPLTIIKTKENTITVPCGRCISCRINYGNSWAGRLYIEDLQSESSWFITLTYNEKNVPRIKTGEPTFNLLHIQNLMKQLRKEIKLRYYLCAEYGEEMFRAHYHALFFFKRKVSYSEIYFLLERFWSQKGFIKIRKIIPKDYKYVSKYLTTKLTGNFRTSFIEQTGLLPEFSVMSRNPGIGYILDYERLRNIMNDKKIYGNNAFYPISRYYKDKYKGCDLEDSEKLQKENYEKMIEYERSPERFDKTFEEKLQAHNNIINTMIFRKNIKTRLDKN